eukprot:Trichotokara_eunicae@DN2168_c0_g1_i1.p1
MDHHCPWVGNCVGSNNIRMFILFSFLTSVGAIFFIAAEAPVLAGITGDKELISMAGVGHGVYFLIQYLFLCGLVLATLGIGFLTLVNMCRDISQIESGYDGENPYDLGCRKNCEKYFGPLGIQWFLPVPYNKGVSGYSYELRTGYTGPGNCVV